MRNTAFMIVKTALIGSALFIQGCETLGPNLSEKRIINGSFPSEMSPKAQKEDPILVIAPVEDNLPRQKAEIYRADSEFLALNNTTKGALSVEDDGSYTFNFSNVDVSEVVKVILGDTLKKNFTISPNVGGNVSMQTSNPLTTQALLPTLQMLLAMNNAVLIEESGLYRVEPLNTALVAGNVPLTLGGSALNGYQINVISLQYMGAQEMKKILEPVLPKNAIVQIDANRNLLLVAGSPADLINTKELIGIFDVDVLQGKSVGLFPLTYVEAETVQKELMEIFGAEGNKDLSGMLQLLPIERMNALMVITSQVKYLERIKQWLARLDRSGAQGQAGHIHVYPVQNVDAVSLAAILEQIYPQQEASSRPRRTSVIAPGLKPVRLSSEPLAKAAIKPVEMKRRVAVSSTVSSETSGAVRIIPDEMNNALVIVASAQDYEPIKKVIKQLDVVPLQVLVDATIIEVSLTDELHYGLQWFFNNKSGRYSGAGRVGDANFNAAGLGGFSYSIVNSADFVRAELNALANDSKINVISSPSLMVLNNQEAIIKVGDQVPIRTSESANTSAAVGDSAIITSTIDMRDSGVTLKVKPRVNAGGLVIMEVEQNVDGVSRTESSEIDSPTIQQRQIKTSVAVASGETIILGGLITEQRELGRSGVPILSRLPIIGSLFGKTDKVLDRTELVVLLTPRVIKNELDARLVTREFKRKLTGIYQELENKESVNFRTKD